MAKVGDKFIVEVSTVIGSVNGENAAYYTLSGLMGRIFNNADLERLQKYEPEEEESLYYKFFVGDEVETEKGERFYITNIEPDLDYEPVITSEGYLYGIYADGKTCKVHSSKVRRTGTRNLALERMLVDRVCEFANDPEKKE